MLVIARRRGEAIRIGPDVTVVVQDIRSRQVKLTISAPPSVAVKRAELDAEHGRGSLAEPEVRAEQECRETHEHRT